MFLAVVTTPGILVTIKIASVLGVSKLVARAAVAKAANAGK